jgi:hypothetical protein
VAGLVLLSSRPLRFDNRVLETRPRVIRLTSMPKDVPSQISEDDREAAVRRLQNAFAKGHISHAEMDDHLQVVLTVKTHGYLAPVIASLQDTDTGRTVTLAGKSGRFRRRGAWRVPRVLKVDSEYRKVDLDLSRAIIAVQRGKRLALGRKESDGNTHGRLHHLARRLRGR